MKALTLGLVAVVMAFFTVTASAAEIVKLHVKGEPIVVTEEKVADGILYVVPETVTDSDYYSFTLGGVRQVCYKEPQTGLGIDAVISKFRMGGKEVALNCYKYSEDYFIVD